MALSTLLATLALVLAVAALGVTVLLLRESQRLRRRAVELEARIAALGPGPPLPVDLSATFGSGQRRILAVEILNPVELATRQVRAAGLLGAVRPALLTRLVYDLASKQVVEKLEEEGVLADVRVHAAR